jgi:hypothetical protein
MRRDCDTREGDRTGAGRRARDRLLAGEVASLPARLPAASRSELANLLLFVADDLRESALAVGGIESFLVAAQRVLHSDELSAARLAQLLDADDLEQRLAALDDAVTALRRSIANLRERL